MRKKWFFRCVLFQHSVRQKGKLHNASGLKLGCVGLCVPSIEKKLPVDGWHLFLEGTFIAIQYWCCNF